MYKFQPLCKEEFIPTRNSDRRSTSDLFACMSQDVAWNVALAEGCELSEKYNTRQVKMTAGRRITTKPHLTA